MSNDAFHHQNEKISHAMLTVVSMLQRRGNREGHRKLKDFAPKIRQDMDKACLLKLGCTREDQLENIEQALELAEDRGLIGFDPASRRLYRTSKGARQRTKYLKMRNTVKKRAQSRTHQGMPAYAR